MTATVCRLFYGGGTINYQVHSIYLGVTSSTGVIPAGTRLTWTVNVSGGGAGTGGTNEVPTTNSSQNNIWSLEISQPAGTATSSFTATLVFNQDLTIGTGTWCAPALVWTDIYSVRPGANISTSTTGTVGSSGTFSGGELSYTVARRHPTSVNTTGRTPHVYLTRSGAQTCYPAISYSRLLNTNGTDNVTTYPTGVTPPGNRCSWDGRFCNSSSTGQSSPAYIGGAASGQYEQPAVC